MATTNLSIEQVSGAKVFQDTDLGATAVAVKASSGSIYAIEIDNTANAAEAEYVKLWDTAQGSVTVGTTAPTMIIPIAAAAKKTVVIPGGLAFGTAITVACVTTAGTAGTTNPTADLICRVVYA